MPGPFTPFPNGRHPIAGLGALENIKISSCSNNRTTTPRSSSLLPSSQKIAACRFAWILYIFPVQKFGKLLRFPRKRQVCKLNCCSAFRLQCFVYRFQNTCLKYFAVSSFCKRRSYGVPNWFGKVAGSMNDTLLGTYASGNSTRRITGPRDTPKVKPTHSPRHQLREHTTIPTKWRWSFPSLKQKQTSLVPKNLLS